MKLIFRSPIVVNMPLNDMTSNWDTDEAFSSLQSWWAFSSLSGAYLFNGGLQGRFTSSNWNNDKVNSLLKSFNPESE